MFKKQYRNLDCTFQGKSLPPMSSQAPAWGLPGPGKPKRAGPAAKAGPAGY
jgi:hypothetical protein